MATPCRSIRGHGHGRRSGGRGRGEDPDAAADAAMATAEDVRWTSAIVEAALENNFVGAFVPRHSPATCPRTSRSWWPRTRCSTRASTSTGSRCASYPHGSLAAHALGYVGRITEEDLETDAVIEPDKPYAATDEIGTTGVEADLRGRGCGASPACASSRSTPTTTWSAQVRYRAPTPGDGRHVDPGHPGADPAGDPAGGHGRGAIDLARRRRGGRGPAERRDHRHGQLPDLQPPGLHRRHRRRGVRRC